jgi:hypothetical protein
MTLRSFATTVAINVAAAILAAYLIRSIPALRDLARP